MLQEVLVELPTLVPRVQKLALDFYSPRYPAAVSGLAELRDLRELRVCGPSEEDEAGRQAFEAANEELRRLRPDVVIETR